MTTYQILHGDNNGSPGTITFAAASDAAAIAKVRELVRDGMRNDAWACVDLADRRIYRASNRHGEAVGTYS